MVKRAGDLLRLVLAEVWLDPEIFYDALLNLAVNAMEAIPEGCEGRVQIKTTRLSGRNQVLIEVLDNGPGIPEELVGKMFKGKMPKIGLKHSPKGPRKRKNQVNFY